MKLNIAEPVAKKLRASAKQNRRSASKEATVIIDKALVAKERFEKIAQQTAGLPPYSVAGLRGDMPSAK